MADAFTWVFVFSAVAMGQGTAFTTGFQSQEACTTYARGYMSRAQTRGVRTAECIGLRNGKVVDFTKPRVTRPVYTEPSSSRSTTRKALL